MASLMVIKIVKSRIIMSKRDKEFNYKPWPYDKAFVSKPEAVLICVILAIFIVVVGAA